MVIRAAVEQCYTAWQAFNGARMLDLAILGLGAWGRRIVDSVQGKSSGLRSRAAVVGRPEPAADFYRFHVFGAKCSIEIRNSR